MVSGALVDDRVVRFGTFELDSRSGELRRAGLRVPLQQQPLTILLRLLERPGQVVTRDVLQRELWPDASFGDFEHGLNAAIKRLRDALDDSADNPRFIETLPKRGYRFIAPLTGLSSAVTGRQVDGAPASTGRRTLRPRTIVFGSALVFTASILAAWLVVRSTPATPAGGLTILVADFVNKTGDVVFDGTLKQAVRTEFEQSPSFHLVSHEQVRQTLKQMTQAPDEPVTGRVALEACERAGANAVLTGSITALGSRYAIGLEAANCESKAVVAEQQIEATDREHVLEAVGRIAVQFRRRLGESAASLRRFGVPISQATTASLEALKAFSVAEQMRVENGDVAAEPYYRRTVELDRDFALAYARLATIYANTQRIDDRNRMNVEAHARRDRVSELERFYIDARYCEAFQSAKDDEACMAIHESWKRTYPLDPVPYTNLCVRYNTRGDYDRAVSNCSDAVRLGPELWQGYQNLAFTLIALNRFADAKKVTDDALAHHADVPGIHALRFGIALATGDVAGTTVEKTAVRGAPEEFRIVRLESEAAAFEGRLRDARDLRARAAQLTNGRFAAFVSEMNSFAVMIHAAAGFTPCEPAPAGTPPDSIDTRERLMAALLCDDYTGAERLSRGIRATANILDPARALIALNAGDGSAIRQMAPLKGSALGTATGFRPQYMRGLAYLRVGDGPAAAAEFRWILDHRGIAVTSPLYALAYVQQARAYAASGDVMKARGAYETFFKLWERADPDVPILIAGKAEYASLAAGPP